MKARILISLEIDEDDYPVPVDGSIKEELNEAIYAYIYDIHVPMRICTCSPNTAVT